MPRPRLSTLVARLAGAAALCCALLPVGAASAQAPAAPLLTAAFAQSVAAPGADVGLSFTVTNNDDQGGRTGVGFTVTLPAGVVVSTPSELFSDCGGTATATAGGTSITLSGATLPAAGIEEVSSSCSVVLDVVAPATAGVVDVAAGPVTSTESGPGAPSNTTSLEVLEPPTITEAFADPSVAVGETTTVTYTLENPNASLRLSGLAFADALPAGIAVDAEPGLETDCATDERGVQADPGATTITLLALVLEPATSCSISVDVTGTAPTAVPNPTGPLGYAFDGGSGDFTSATADGDEDTLTVIGPAVLSAGFGAASVAPGATTTLTFSLTNPNTTTALSGIAFDAALSAGLRVATPSGLTGGCGGGTVTAVAGGDALGLTGGALTAGGSCSFSVNVTAIAVGTQTVTPTAVSTEEGGVGAAPEPATLAVAVPPPPAPGPGGPGPGAGPPPSTQPPSTVFLVGTVKGSKSGTVTFDVGVPGSGSVEVLETMGRSAAPASRAFNPGDGRLTFARKTAKASKAGKLHITIKPGVRGKKAVRSKRNRRGLRLNVWVRFTPTGYKPTTGSRLHTIYRRVRVGG